MRWALAGNPERPGEPGVRRAAMWRPIRSITSSCCWRAWGSRAGKCRPGTAPAPQPRRRREPRDLQPVPAARGERALGRSCPPRRAGLRRAHDGNRASRRGSAGARRAGAAGACRAGEARRGDHAGPRSGAAAGCASGALGHRRRRYRGRRLPQAPAGRVLLQLAGDCRDIGRAGAAAGAARPSAGARRAKARAAWLERVRQLDLALRGRAPGRGWMRCGLRAAARRSRPSRASPRGGTRPALLLAPLLGDGAAAAAGA